MPQIQQDGRQVAQRHGHLRERDANPSRPELVLSSSTGGWPGDSSRSRNSDVASSRGSCCASTYALTHILEPREAYSANAGSQSTAQTARSPAPQKASATRYHRQPYPPQHSSMYGRAAAQNVLTLFVGERPRERDPDHGRDVPVTLGGEQ